MIDHGKKQFGSGENRHAQHSQFRDALNNTELRESLFTGKFIEGLEKRRDALAGHEQKLKII